MDIKIEINIQGYYKGFKIKDYLYNISNKDYEYLCEDIKYYLEERIGKVYNV